MKTLTRGGICLYEANRRDNIDRRRKVAWAVFSYFDEDGNEYRRSFTLMVDTPESIFMKIAPLTISI
jgi:hypothetical protein